MAIIKCKMCGGDIELNEEKTFGTCEYCGSVMTLPKVSDDQRAARFNRGNHFRRIGEFDKALAVYEKIVSENEQDAEAHWCCALCRFGIEYVEDPLSHRRVPTVHRAQFTSIFDDDNYKLALKNADSYQRIIYEEEAKAINEIVKTISTVNIPFLIINHQSFLQKNIFLIIARLEMFMLLIVRAVTVKNFLRHIAKN